MWRMGLAKGVMGSAVESKWSRSVTRPLRPLKTASVRPAGFCPVRYGDPATSTQPPLPLPLPLPSTPSVGSANLVEVRLEESDERPAQLQLQKPPHSPQHHASKAFRIPRNYDERLERIEY